MPHGRIFKINIIKMYGIRQRKYLVEIIKVILQQ